MTFVYFFLDGIVFCFVFLKRWYLSLLMSIAGDVENEGTRTARRKSRTSVQRHILEKKCNKKVAVSLKHRD